jgi:putative DNA primase/helicase
MSTLHHPDPGGKPGGDHAAHGAAESGHPILDTARWAIDAGLWPIAITAIDDRRSRNPGKAPLGHEWGKEQHDEAWWQATLGRYPGAGIGLKLGADGKVIDIDVDDLELAYPTLARLFPDGIPATLGWHNAAGKFHLLFLYDRRLARFKPIIKGVVDKGGEIIGNPHYLGIELRIGAPSGDDKQYQSVIPPSLLSNGQPRRWNGQAKILPLPESFFEDLDRHALETAPKPREDREPAANGSTTAWAEAAIKKELDRLASAPQGTRNDTLNGAAFNLGQIIGGGAADRGRVEAALAEEARRIGLGEREAAATIKSGIEAGTAQPRSRPEIKPRGRATPTANGNGRRSGEPPPGGGDDRGPAQPKPNEASDDPHRLGRLYLKRAQHSAGLTLRFWREEWHRWDGTAYRVAPDKEVRGELAGTVKAEFDRLNLKAQALANGKPPKVRPVTTKLVANVTLALTDLALLRARDCPQTPAWLCEDPPWPAGEVLPCRNALVHLPSLVERKPCTRLPSPAFFCPYNLDFDFNPDAPDPIEWLKFLGELWPEDPESIALLQEWFGYCLSSDTSQQKMLMLIGPKRSGKGTITRVLRALIGAENVANPTLSQLSTPFGAAPLIGKLVATINDARLSGRADQAVIVERLLSITGEDSQTIDRKHRDSWEGKLAVRFVLISNELPRLNDASAALPSRMLILKLVQSFLGKEDKDLLSKLLAELPGILLWAVNGWDRLRKRGRFAQPKSAEELVEAMEALASPVTVFVRERCKVDDAVEVKTKTLFQAWLDWCKEKGRSKPGDEQNFGRNLRAVIPRLKTRVTSENDQHVRYYVGVDLAGTPF